MNVDKLKIGDEVYFPKNDTVSQITERIGKLVYIDNQTLSPLKYGFDFGEGYLGNRLMANDERFSIPNPTGIWLAEFNIKQGYRVYSGENLKKIKPGDTVKVVNQIHKEMIGDTFVVQAGYRDNELYTSAVSQQLKLIRISKRDKHKEPSPTPQQETTDMNDQQIESEIQAKGTDRVYRPVSAMTFGDALVMIKEGHRVCRAGWNGKGMWLAMVAADGYCVPNQNYVACPEFEGEPHLLPWIGMKTADNGFVPWLASQTDMLAEDWMLLED